MDFEDYVRSHGQGLLRFATVLADDPATAEDVVQEVLLRAHSRWLEISATARPHAYVRRMIVNEMISWRRRWGRMQPRPPEDLDRLQPDPSLDNDSRDAVIRALRKLPPRQRAAVVLRYYEDLDDGDIAELMGCRPTTVRGYVHRALKQLNVTMSADHDSVMLTERIAR